MSILDKVREFQKRGTAAVPKPPKVDPDLKKLVHYVHSALTLTPTELVLLRRYIRKEAGELAPESTFGPLPLLTPPTK